MGKKLLKLLDYLKESILQILFPCPSTCIVCEVEEAEGICKNCLKTIKLCTEDECYGYYKGVLRKLIYLFKFKKDFLAGEILANMLEVKLADVDKEYILTYIPISKKSKKTRGFNQCEYIAKILSKNLGLNHMETLVKSKETRIQKELSRSERLENVKDSFCIKSNCNIEGKKFILIDDVITSGATINEGVKTLKENGANEIKILTIAKSRI